MKKLITFAFVMFVAACGTKTTGPVNPTAGGCPILYCMQGYHQQGCSCVPDHP